MKNKEVRKKRTAHLFHIISTTVFVVFLIVLVGIILFLSFSPSSWDGKRRFTIVVQDNPSNSKDNQSTIGIFSIEPQENRAVYFILPANALLDVPYGYGPYPVRSVYPLGLLDGHHKAGLIVAKAVQSTLGVYIDGYIINKGKSSITPQNENDLFSFKKKTFSLLKSASLFPSLFQKTSPVMDTNLTLSDQNTFFWKVRSLRNDQIKFISLEDSFIITENKSPDGSTVLDIDKDQFELLVAGAFQDSRVRSENLSVEVVNAAGIEKLASSMALIFEHIGANVISISTAKNDQEKVCQIILDEKKLEQSETVKLFIKLFTCSIKLKTDEKLQGDVRIILGKDFIK